MDDVRSLEFRRVRDHALGKRARSSAMVAGLTAAWIHSMRLISRALAQNAGATGSKREGHQEGLRAWNGRE